MRSLIIAVLLVVCSVNAWGQDYSYSKDMVTYSRLDHEGNHSIVTYYKPAKIDSLERWARMVWDKWYGAPVDNVLDIRTPTKHLTTMGSAYYDSISTAHMIVDSAKKKITLWASPENFVTGRIIMKNGKIYTYHYDSNLSKEKGMAVFTAEVPLNFNIDDIKESQWCKLNSLLSSGTMEYEQKFAYIFSLYKKN